MFAATSDDNRELWKSDGTEVNTVMVKDLNPGDSSSPQDFFALDGAVYFLADATGGKGLWTTDGTDGGTTEVIAVGYPDFGGLSAPFAGGKQFFTGSDDDGNELWVTDGTEGGTKLIKDICSGACSSDPSVANGSD